MAKPDSPRTGPLEQTWRRRLKLKYVILVHELWPMAPKHRAKQEVVRHKWPHFPAIVDFQKALHILWYGGTNYYKWLIIEVQADQH